MANFPKRKREESKLSLTSLMDALTIILFFLIMNYSDVVEEFDPPNFVQMPVINAKIDQVTTVDLSVAIGMNKIRVGKDKDIDFRNFKSEESTIVAKFQEILKIESEAVKARKIASSPENAKKPIKMSIQADKGVPYFMINSLVMAGSELGMNIFDMMGSKVEE
jgi:biopolymer transport protein ExbD